MPLTFHAIRPGPAQSPEDAVVACPLRRVLVTLRIRNANAPGKPVLNGKRIALGIGAAGIGIVDTDDNGDVTLEYRGDDGALSDEAARVTWNANNRYGDFKLSAATQQQAAEKLEIYFLEVDVAGTFTLQVDILALRPWNPDGSPGDHGIGLAVTTGTVRWTDAAGTQQSRTIACDVVRTPSFALADLPCGTEIVVEGGVTGAIGGEVELSIDEGGWLPAGDVAVDSGIVRYRREAQGKSWRAVVDVDRHETTVHVQIGHRFPKALIVGEGTYFDYAAGLAEKYGSVGSGLLWVYASQYDVTPVASLPTVYAGVKPQDGTAQNYDQRARVQGLCAHNLLVVPGLGRDDSGNAGRFDATDEDHWDDLDDRYGEFDAIIFNNPHPGYGLHECVVFGLKSTSRQRDKGRYISVHTIGYDVPARAAISDANWTAVLRKITGKRFAVQRGVLVNDLGYANRPAATVLTFLESGVAQNVPIHTAFRYVEGKVGIANDPPRTPYYYGGTGEFAADAQEHYECIVTALGLHAHVMRSYRRYAPKVLASGGELFLHGAAVYERDLTSQVRDGSAVLAEAMESGVSWKDDGRFFVWYPTNFTSSRFHPSHFTSGYDALREPSLRNAMMYRYRKP